MALFPQSFIDEVRQSADIVQVVQDVVSLRRSGATYKGLCPFHGEKTPSFHVNRERGFFHCFGCGVGGDAIKFVELYEKLSFQEAVRQLAQRFGIAIPEPTRSGQELALDAERETLLKMHEVAAAYFREQLAGPAGARARQQLSARGLTAATIERLGLGVAPTTRDGLTQRLKHQGFGSASLVRSGLTLEREGGQIVDRFRQRLMIPICRETGSVVAFGGRAMEDGQQPKYLNSPETPIYVKSRTLYGLHLTKAAIRKAGYVVLVEGYFDLAQVLQETDVPVVAMCGTALAAAQAQALRRFTSRVVLSLDPDSAGQSAAARSSELLVAEGFQVEVAVLPSGLDPDTYVRKYGGQAYSDRIGQAGAWLDFLLERAARTHDLDKATGRQAFISEMLAVAARIPDAPARDQFADRLAHRARVSEEVVRAEIRKAAVGRRTTVAVPQLTGTGQLKPVEQELLAALLNAPADAQRALAELGPGDLDGLGSSRVLLTARALLDQAPEVMPGLLLERLSEEEGRLITALAARRSAAPAMSPAECARVLRVLRHQRDLAALQRAIDRAQERGAATGPEFDGLLQQKSELMRRLAACEETLM
ncbi:MAG: DNA primase [Acidobacteria bacterium]|nr:DNA primase [Acidobacteriota bacterium]